MPNYVKSCVAIGRFELFEDIFSLQLSKLVSLVGNSRVQLGKLFLNANVKSIFVNSESRKVFLYSS
jgi:hypothetical protein